MTLVAAVIAFPGRAWAQASLKDEILLCASIFQNHGKLTLGEQTLYAAGLTLKLYKLNDYFQIKKSIKRTMNLAALVFLVALSLLVAGWNLIR